MNVTRGREMARFARLDYERLRPEIYGQKQEVNVSIDHKVQIENSLTSSALELFQSMRGHTQPNQQVIDVKPEPDSHN